MIRVESLPMMNQLQAECDLNRLVRNHTDVLLSVFKIESEETSLVSLFGTGYEKTNKEALRVWVKKVLVENPDFINLLKLRDLLEIKLKSFCEDWQ
jgi:hypothetical protein